MKKAVFNNINFYYGVILCLVVLILWNLYTVYTGNILGLLPVTINIILLVLLILKNQYAKIGLKIFSMIFLIIAPSLQLFSSLLKIFIGEPETIDIQKTVFNVVSLSIGVLIFYFTNKTVEVIDNISVNR